MILSGSKNSKSSKMKMVIRVWWEAHGTLGDWDYLRTVSIVSPVAVELQGYGTRKY